MRGGKSVPKMGNQTTAESVNNKEPKHGIFIQQIIAEYETLAWVWAHSCIQRQWYGHINDQN